MTDTAAKTKTITVWVISTCIPEPGEAHIPLHPCVLATKEQCDAEFDNFMRSEWETNAPSHEDTGNPLPYPDDADEAHEILSKNQNWGRYLITSHQIEVAV